MNGEDRRVTINVPREDPAPTTTKETYLFWLVTTFEYEDIDAKRGHVNLKAFTKWYWRSKEELEVIEVGYHQIFKRERESEYFPVSPSHPFKNWIVLDKVEHMSKAQSTLSESQEYPDLPYFNFAQKMYRVSLQTKLNMQHYPFDRHLVPVILALREWKRGKWELMGATSEERREIGLGGEQPAAPRDLFPEGYKLYEEDKRVVSLTDNWEFYRGELKQAEAGLEPFVEVGRKRDGRNKAPVIYLRLERDPAPAIFYIAFPSFIIVSIVMMLVFQPDNETEYAAEHNPQATLEPIGGGLLALIASQLATINKLPESSYVTIADKYLLLSYVVLLLLGLKQVLAQHAETWNAKIDVVVWWVFAALWSLLHIFIVMEFKEWYKIFSRLFLLDWGKIPRPDRRCFYYDRNNTLGVDERGISRKRRTELRRRSSVRM